MLSSERHIEERLGAALFKLAALERKALAAPDTPRVAEKLAEEVRKLTAELERAFRNVQQLLSLLSDARHDAASATELADLLFRMSSVACVRLDRDGVVVDANGAAVRLLNCSQRHLVGRAFHLFVARARDVFLRRLKELPANADPCEWDVVIRPRERSIVTGVAVVAPDPTGRLVLMIRPGATAAAAEEPPAA